MRIGPPCSSSSGRRSRSRSSSSPSRVTARCSCGSPPAASATPICTRPRAPIRPGTRRACSATRAPGSSSGSATASRSVRPGDHVVTLFSPQCGECVHCLSRADESLPRDPRAAEPGYLPDGTTRLSRDGEPIRHFMGTSTFAEYTVMPEIALAKVEPEAPLEGCVPVRVRALDRDRRRDLHRARRAGLDRASSSAAGMVGLGAVIGVPAAGRGADRLRRPLRRTGSRWPRHHGATETLAGRRRHGRADRERPAASAPTTRSRRPATSPSCGRRSRRRARAGASHHVRRRRQGRDARGRPALPDHRPPRRRLVVRRRQGPRRRCPQLVDRWLAGDIDVESFISHRLTLDEVNHGFELMERQDGIRSVIGFA